MLKGILLLGAFLVSVIVSDYLEGRSHRHEPEPEFEPEPDRYERFPYYRSLN